MKYLIYVEGALKYVEYDGEVTQALVDFEVKHGRIVSVSRIKLRTAA